MSKHNKHAQSEHTHHHDEARRPSKKGIHRDWRLWVAVVLMLAAIGAYLATMDESLQPASDVGPEFPAATE
jgi:hypothetical protein